MSTFHLLLPERMQLANFSNHFVTTFAKSPKSGIFLMERRERKTMLTAHAPIQHIKTGKHIKEIKN